MAFPARATRHAGTGQIALHYSSVPHLEKPMTAKETVRALLDRLPDDCSLEDVLYHLYVVQATARGLADYEAGRTIPQTQVDAEMRRKWLLSPAE